MLLMGHAIWDNGLLPIRSICSTAAHCDSLSHNFIDIDYSQIADPSKSHNELIRTQKR